MSANPLVVNLSNLLKPHEEQYELKKDLIGQVVKLVGEKHKTDTMEDYVAELKAEAEDAVMKTLEKILSEKEEFVGMDKSYWTKVIYKMSEKEASIKKLRADNMKLRKKIKDMESEYESLKAGAEDEVDRLNGIIEGKSVPC